MKKYFCVLGNLIALIEQPGKVNKLYARFSPKCTVYF